MTNLQSLYGERMSVWWAEIACAVGVGLLLGMMWARWAIWSYIQSKTPDAVGWRSAFSLRGKFYYVVSEREYVDRVMFVWDGADSATGKGQAPHDRQHGTGGDHSWRLGSGKAAA